MWITYISDYGIRGKAARNRKTGVNHRVNLRDTIRTIVHKYNMPRWSNKNPCNSTAEKNGIGFRRVSEHLPRHEPSMLSLSAVLCTRFEKSDLFGNTSALYIVMEHTSEKRRCALHHHHHLFSPRDFYFTFPLSSHTPGIFIFITTTFLSQQIPSHRGDNRFSCARSIVILRHLQINKSANLSYSNLSHNFAFLICGERNVLFYR